MLNKKTALELYDHFASHAEPRGSMRSNVAYMKGYYQSLKAYRELLSQASNLSEVEDKASAFYQRALDLYNETDYDSSQTNLMFGGDLMGMTFSEARAFYDGATDTRAPIDSVIEELLGSVIEEDQDDDEDDDEDYEDDDEE